MERSKPITKLTAAVIAAVFTTSAVQAAVVFDTFDCDNDGMTEWRISSVAPACRRR